MKKDATHNLKCSGLASSTHGFIRQRVLLRDYLPFSAATLWRMVRSGHFPSPEKLSPQIVAWRLTDVLAWLENPAAYRKRKSQNIGREAI
jgi:predicted DNA-binding transcriptional regulator AlpA